MKSNFHERLEQEAVPLPSDRSTGLVFAAVAMIVAYMWRSNETILYVALIMAGGLALVSLLVPKVLRPLNIVWMKFALLVNMIMNPIVMFILFVCVIVPAGLIMQLRSDPLQQKRQTGKNSYWIERSDDVSSSMTNQF